MLVAATLLWSLVWRTVNGELLVSSYKELIFLLCPLLVQQDYPVTGLFKLMLASHLALLLFKIYSLYLLLSTSYMASCIQCILVQNGNVQCRCSTAESGYTYSVYKTSWVIVNWTESFAQTVLTKSSRLKLGYILVYFSIISEKLHSRILK
jgi:hypothetical protein